MIDTGVSITAGDRSSDSQDFVLNQKPTGHLFFYHDSCWFLEEQRHYLPILLRYYPSEVCRDYIYVFQQIEPRLSIGSSVVPSIWPSFSMTFVQTSRHMYESTNVECDRPVIVSAYLIGVPQRKKYTTSNIWQTAYNSSCYSDPSNEKTSHDVHFSLLDILFLDIS